MTVSPRSRPSPSPIFTALPAPLGAPSLVGALVRTTPRVSSTHRPALIPSSVPWTFPTRVLISPVQTPTLSFFNYRMTTWNHRPSPMGTKLPPLSSCPLLWIFALALPQKRFAPRLHNSWNPGSPSGCLRRATPAKNHAPLPPLRRASLRQTPDPSLRNPLNAHTFQKKIPTKTASHTTRILNLKMNLLETQKMTTRTPLRSRPYVTNMVQ